MQAAIFAAAQQCVTESAYLYAYYYDGNGTRVSWDRSFEVPDAAACCDACLNDAK